MNGIIECHEQQVRQMSQMRKQSKLITESRQREIVKKKRGSGVKESIMWAIAAVILLSPIAIFFVLLM